ncbi:nitroreductase family protein [Enterococcus sp. DIV0242_7C1]|uniref:Nitroreductase n=1 Tax=Candidatus Enterococcus dunnyi TaxID=1834192 RepID=A0A200IVH2_9ENTE|nr:MULTISPECIES: nitroreductase family protein [unclassified Enterococcus]MBO0471218.1 nitroreductase family protein [Enterococcus sp. DIV0242_7C1]MCA5013951.1 nitroreductase family protein [Enterococcus sp. S23]MCA5017275.1 nitroreductase family protein [Enterococcus sp. S22(2020)]OUZ28390.1 nitroreductase [Enterococcus sp. 9D6_DIV0238]
MTEFIQALKKRRSIYALGTNVTKSNEEIEALVKEVVRESPSSFNSQTQRVVFLFGDAHKKLWSITEEALKPLTPAEAFPNTQAKLQSFAAGKGTILFFEDQDVVKSLQEQFELYAENFPIWSEQASGLTQANVWTALAQENIGANLQHYNPVIDEAVAKEWSIPSNWKLRGQLVFGSIEEAAGSKEYMEDSARFKTFG